MDAVLARYTLPAHITPHPLQVQAVNEQADLPESGQFLDTGTGKTLVATCTALFKRMRYGVPTLVIMPPVLVKQWARWLASVIPKQGPPLKVVAYEGTPAKRQKLQAGFADADFVLMGQQILQRDWHAVYAWALSHTPNVIVDEATIVANIGSQTHEAIRVLSANSRTELLTGTPADPPISAYGLLKFTNPTAYENFVTFKALHVEEFDMFGMPKVYKDLHKLNANMAVNAQRILFNDMYPNMELPQYITDEYDLDPKHEQLYGRLAEDRILLLPDGGKLDATAASKLFNALGQIVLNWDHFAQDPGLVSAGLKYLDNRLEELGSEKVMIVANYRMSIAALNKRYGKQSAGFINSEASDAEKQRTLTRFTGDEKARLIFINPRSGGYGLDGLQHVCRTAVFMEPCTVPKDFKQTVARLNRTGQKQTVRVYLPTALGTVQRKQFRQLLNKDELVNEVIRGIDDLRRMIYGQD